MSFIHIERIRTAWYNTQSRTTFWRQVTMVTFIINLKAQEGKGEVVAEAFKKHAVLVNQDEGTIAFKVLRREDDPDSFLIYEVYKSKAILDENMKKPRFLELTSTINPVLVKEPEPAFILK